MGWIAPTPGALALLRARRPLPVPPRTVPPPGPAPAPPTPGLARPTFDTLPPPAFLYHPHTERVVVGGDEVRSVAGEGSPPLSATATGPDQRTDALGRRFWRFEGTDWLELPRAFVSTPRAMTVLMIGRMHQNRTANLFGHLYRDDGSTIANTLGAFLNTYSSGGRVGALRTSSLTTAALAGREWMVPGAQLGLMGVASRDTGAGGSRF